MDSFYMALFSTLTSSMHFTKTVFQYNALYIRMAAAGDYCRIYSNEWWSGMTAQTGACIDISY